MQFAFGVFIVVLLALVFVGFFTGSRDMQTATIQFALLGIIVMLAVALFAELRGPGTDDTTDNQHTTTATVTVTAPAPQP